MYFAYGDTELSYLRQKDKRLCEVIDRIGHIDRAVDTDLFSSVIHHIIGQQISTKAQATIWQRMQDALGAVNVSSAGCVWYIITVILTASYLKNIAVVSTLIAAWQVCISGRSQAEQYRR